MASRPCGEQFGLYPAIEINLHLNHICPAQQRRRDACRYAFGRLGGGTNLLPCDEGRPAKHHRGGVREGLCALSALTATPGGSIHRGRDPTCSSSASRNWRNPTGGWDQQPQRRCRVRRRHNRLRRWAAVQLRFALGLHRSEPRCRPPHRRARPVCWRGFSAGKPMHSRRAIVHPWPEGHTTASRADLGSGAHLTASALAPVPKRWHGRQSGLLLRGGANLDRGHLPGSCARPGRGQRQCPCPFDRSGLPLHPVGVVAPPRARLTDQTLAGRQHPMCCGAGRIRLPRPDCPP